MKKAIITVLAIISATYAYSQAGSLSSSDLRSVNASPVDRNSGLYADFKENATDGLTDGNLYHGVLTFRPYGSTTDMSGGGVHQLGFTEGQNIYYRHGTLSTWQGWKRLVFNSELGSSAYQSDASYLKVSPTSNHPSNGSFAIGSYSGRNFIQSHGSQPLDINPLGNSVHFNTNVGIGTNTLDSDSRLTVAGKIHSREVKVTITAGADFVFQKDYNLKPLSEVAEYISVNKHLPEIASAKEMKKNGLELGEMNIKLLQKIEELTLYIIDQNKKIEEQQKQLLQQNERLQSVEKKVIQ